MHGNAGTKALAGSLMHGPRRMETRTHGQRCMNREAWKMELRPYDGVSVPLGSTFRLVGSIRGQLFGFVLKMQKRGIKILDDVHLLQLM